MHTKEIMLALACHHIGTIESFDETSQTASVTVNYKKTFFDYNPTNNIYAPRYENYPILAECPVICLGGGTGALTFPIKKGDECLVLFNDRDLDNWFTGGTGSPNATARLHSFSDGVVLVGVRSLAKALVSYDTQRAVLRNGAMGDTIVGVGDSLIKIANASTTLNTLLQSFVSKVEDLSTAIQSLTVLCSAPGSPSGPPVNIASFVAVSADLMTLGTQIGQLLE